MLVYALAPLGLEAFLSRSAARGVPTGELMGSVGALMGAIGVAVGCFGVVVVQLVPGQSEAVRVMLTVGFGLLPVALLGGLLQAVNVGLERWSIVLLARSVSPLIALVGIGVLYSVGALTVTTAALVTIVGAGPAAVVVQLGLLREARPLRIDKRLARQGLAFGLRAWLALLASVTNARLDQALLIVLVDRRDLGLYVIAVTLSGFSGIVGGAIGAAIGPKVSRGDPELGVRAVRVTLVLVLAASLAIGILVRPLLTKLFGADFAEATTMARVLLAASVPLAGMGILSLVTISAGHPGEAARAELVAVFVTVPGILLLVPPLGVEGAALVSLAAYSVAFGVLLLRVRRLWSIPIRRYLMVSPTDVSWFSRLLRDRLAQLRG
jgi:O-antigen/teichoic acid export membrane protein